MNTSEADDYEIIKRTKEESFKYVLADPPHPENPNPVIVSSIADMDFKVPQRLLKKLQNFCENPHFGYCTPTKGLWNALSNWINTRYGTNIPVQQSTTTFYGNMIILLSAVLMATTEEEDEVLLFVPAYHKFIEDIGARNRKCVPFELNTQGDTFEIDFEKLQQCLKSHKIKLLIFSNPWNPTGKIWSHDQISKLKDLILKYKLYVYSDEVFSDAIIDPQVFTSFLKFSEELKDVLIYGNSHSKSMNCSGMSAAYSITQNQKLNKQLFMFQTVWCARPSKAGFWFLELSITDPIFREWNINTEKYIQENYKYFKELCKQKVPKLKIKNLDCSYLIAIDFCDYNINFARIRQYFQRVNVTPVYMSSNYTDERVTSLIRLNLGMNRAVVTELVNRLQQLVALPWIE